MTDPPALQSLMLQVSAVLTTFSVNYPLVAVGLFLLLLLALRRGLLVRLLAAVLLLVYGAALGINLATPVTAAEDCPAPPQSPVPEQSPPPFLARSPAGDQADARTAGP
jgi:disulfide bond formation protein DsbB